MEQRHLGGLTGAILFSVELIATTMSAAGPTVVKSFAPDTITAGQTAAMTIVLTNPNPYDLTGVHFTDVLPLGLTTDLPSFDNTCGQVSVLAGGGTLLLSSGVVPANGICTISVPATSSIPSTYTNVIAVGAVMTDQGEPNTAGASATLTVLPLAGSVKPVLVAKSFNPSPIVAGGTSLLTITLTNPNDFALIDVLFLDELPFGLQATLPLVVDTCGPLNVLSGSIGLFHGVVPANGNCVVSMNVGSFTPGTYTNTIPAGGVTSSNGVPNAEPASATLVVSPFLNPLPIVIAKSFNPATIVPGQNSLMTFTITNPNPVSIAGIQFTDVLPIPLHVVDFSNISNPCSGASLLAGGGTFIMNQGLIPANGTCITSMEVTSSNIGMYVNTIPAGGVTSLNGVTNAVAATATLQVGLSPPMVTKAFNPASIAAGGTSTMTITLTNPNAQPITGVGFADLYPAGLANNLSPSPQTTCGGLAAAVPGGSAAGLSGGTIPANGSCTVTVLVGAAQPGIYPNTIAVAAVQSANAVPNAVAATATLTALAPIPTLTGWAAVALALLLSVCGIIVSRPPH